MLCLNNEEKFNRYGYYLAGLAALASVIAPNIMRVCSYLVIILVFLRYYNCKIGIKLDSILKIGILTFFIGLFLASSFAPNWSKDYHETYTFFEIMWPFLISYAFVNNRRQMVVVVTLLAISIGVAAVYGIYQGLDGDTVRVTAFFSHPNRLALFLDIYIPLLYIATFERDILPRNGRIVTSIILIFAIMALILTGTRGAWLAVGITFIAYAMMKIKYNKKIGAVLCLIFLLLVVSLLHVDQVRSRVDTLFDPQFVSNSERVLIWESAVAMWRDYPITGVGLSSFKAQEVKYISPLHKEVTAQHAHNNFLNFLAVTGVIGLIAYVVLFTCIIYQLIRYRKNPLAIAVLISTCNLLLNGLVDYTFGYRPAMQAYWFTLGLSLVSVKILPKRKEVKL
ncbi:MAG: hypothetical protein H6Q73_3952 [Firmicutes bacterium]|nr:hypothetical protein [Bacillota bacterium]